MRITGYSDFNLRSILTKNNPSLVAFLKNTSEVKGKIINVNSNAIKLLLENGKELFATSNIPLENLLGEEVNFKVLKGENGLILQPKIEGTALEKELSLKIDHLMNELQIGNTKENKELIREMIKQNIPVNNENFKLLKENIGALKILSNLPKEELQDLNKNIENIEDKDLREIVKKIYINKEGKNLGEGIKDLKNIDLKEKDILFLFKNDFKLNIENLKILDKFLIKGESLEKILNEINTLLLENEDVDLEGKAFKDISLEKADLSKKDKGLEIADKKIMHQEEIIKEVSIGDKKEIKEIIKSLIKNFEVDKEVNVEKIKQDLEFLLKNIGTEKEINLGKLESKQLGEVGQKLEFLNKLSNDYMYFQVPFHYKEYRNLAEILLKDKAIKKGKNGKDISIFISLNTHNLNRIDSMLRYENKDLKILFGIKDEDTKKIFKVFENKLINALKKIGMKNIYIDYKIQEENESILNRLEEVNNAFSNFNIWV